MTDRFCILCSYGDSPNLPVHYSGPAIDDLLTTDTIEEALKLKDLFSKSNPDGQFRIVTKLEALWWIEKNNYENRKRWTVVKSGPDPMEICFGGNAP